MNWPIKVEFDNNGVIGSSVEVSKESLLSLFRKRALDDGLFDCDGTADRSSFTPYLIDLFGSDFPDEDWSHFEATDNTLKILDGNSEMMLTVRCNSSDSYDYEFGLFKEDCVSKTNSLKYAPNENVPPYLFILCARLLWDSDDLSKFSPYEILPSMQLIIADSIDEAESYYLEDVYASDLFGKPFKLDELEGSYDQTLYEWIHLYLVKYDLYSLFLEEEQLKAMDVPDGSIYGPDSEVDDNADEIDYIITTLQNELILSCAIVGVNYPDMLTIAPFAQYFEENGMEDAMVILDQAIEDKFSKS